MKKIGHAPDLFIFTAPLVKDDLSEDDGPDQRSVLPPSNSVGANWCAVCVYKMEMDLSDNRS